MRLDPFSKRNFEPKRNDVRPLQEDAALRALIDTLPEAIFLIDMGERVAAANPAARALLPTLREGEPLARSLRAPDVLDALGRVLESGRAEKALWIERLPVESWFEALIAPLRVEGYAPAAMIAAAAVFEPRRIAEPLELAQLEKYSTKR